MIKKANKICWKKPKLTPKLYKSCHIRKQYFHFPNFWNLCKQKKRQADIDKPNAQDFFEQMAQFFNRGGSFLVRSKFSLSSVSSRLNSTVQFQSNLKVLKFLIAINFNLFSPKNSSNKMDLFHGIFYILFKFLLDIF